MELKNRITGVKGFVTSMALATSLVAPSAHAVTVLVFGQNGTANTVSITTNGGNTQSTITGTNVAVTLTAIENGASGTQAFLNFTATSSSAATIVNGDVQQNFGGSWTITSGTNGTGTNYLSGAFSDIGVGTQGGHGFILSAATPGDSVNPFTSDVITSLDFDRAISLAFTNFMTQVAICGTTLCAGNASVAGNFSAEPTRVPEPGSLALLGLGLVGLGVVRRRKG